MNIPSFSVFEQLVKDSVKSEGKVKDVQFVTGITDYDELFNNSIPKEVTGKLYYLVIFHFFYLCIIYRFEFCERNPNFCKYNGKY